MWEEKYPPPSGGGVGGEMPKARSLGPQEKKKKGMRAGVRLCLAFPFMPHGGHGPTEEIPGPLAGLVKNTLSLCCACGLVKPRRRGILRGAPGTKYGCSVVLGLRPPTCSTDSDTDLRMPSRLVKYRGPVVGPPGHVA